MSLQGEPFGEVAGRPARAFRLDSGAGVRARLTDFGARLTELHVPGRTGETADIVLGFDDAAAYAASPAYFGATVGRYGNRIRRGRFLLEGREIAVDCNEGPNHLHGGRQGWDSRIWEVAAADARAITFRTSSADGEMGFPGACAITSTYRLDGTRLTIEMVAVPDATTIINMVHHSYVNLAGHASGDVLAQEMRIAADHYVPVDGELLATGEILAVAGTPYDFRERHPIGRDLAALPPVGADVFQGGGGWDYNWCLRDMPGPDGLREAAEIHDPASGRSLRLRTTEPGLQMYTGGYLHDGIVGKGGRRYRQYAGFTLETQKFPDSPRFPQFPTTTVHAGETYRQVMVLDLSVE